MGQGSPVLLIPGANDGMSTVARQTFGGPVSSLYRRYAHAHRVIGVCRRDPLPPGANPRSLAADYAWVIEKLALGPVHVEGGSAGGPVALWLAIDRPDLVRSLVLSATLAHTDEKFRIMIGQWINWIRAKKWYALEWDVVYRGASPRFRKLAWLFFLLMWLMPGEKNVARQIALLEGLSDFDFRPDLARIVCPTLVIGGDVDMVTRFELQQELAKGIPNASQVIIRDQGHAYAFEKPTEHVRHVLTFYAEAEKS